MSTAARSENQPSDFDIPAFLTAYDPSDLPGGSMDPMGFERGYLFLADKILPGLTNAGSRPRYFGMLCAGVYLAEVDAQEPPRAQYRNRLDCAQRLERLWALANVLAEEESGQEDSPLGGLRGVQYARARAELLHDKGLKETDADFKMLARQVPYGAIGIYGAVADGMRLLDRPTLEVTPDLGERLAEAFIEETRLPKPIVKAVREEVSVSMAVLSDWGARAHIAGKPGPGEAACLREALHQNPVRSRMACLLTACPSEDEKELDRLRRIAGHLEHDPQQADLREAILAILAFEECYRLAQLGLERLLWLDPVEASKLKDDEVMCRIAELLPGAVDRLRKALDTAATESMRQGLGTLADVSQFLERAAACPDPSALAQAVMVRHADVQHGKFDRGRRKMPWLELTAGRISRNTTRVGGLGFEAKRPEQIVAHAYRVDTADGLIAAGGER